MRTKTSTQASLVVDILTVCDGSPGTGISHVSLSVERDTDSSPRLSNTGSSTNEVVSLQEKEQQRESEKKDQMKDPQANSNVNTSKRQASIFKLLCRSSLYEQNVAGSNKKD